MSLIGDGVLGTIDSLEARFERWSVVGPEWRETAEEAGGPHRDLGAHLVDQSLLLFGDAVRVFAQIDSRRPGSLVEDSAFVAIDHAHGVRSRLWTSLIAARTGPRLRIRGLDGEYIKDDLDPQEQQLLDGLRPGDAGFGEEPAERWGSIRTSAGSRRSCRRCAATTGATTSGFATRSAASPNGRSIPPIRCAACACSRRPNGLPGVAPPSWSGRASDGRPAGSASGSRCGASTSAGPSSWPSAARSTSSASMSCGATTTSCRRPPAAWARWGSSTARYSRAGRSCSAGLGSPARHGWAVSCRVAPIATRACS